MNNEKSFDIMEYISHSAAETENIAAEIAKTLVGGEYIALYGNMGAGKTAFTRGLVKQLAPECLQLVHSPTFAIVNEYRGERFVIYHYDLYRLTDEDDLISTGFSDYNDGKAIVISEWSELFDDILPADRIRITIEILSETDRRITVC